MLKYVYKKFLKKNLYMMIIDQMKQTHFSNAESMIVDYLIAHSDQVKDMTSRDHLRSKIGNLTTNIAIIFILDVLYSLVFAEDYAKNLQTYNDLLG